MLPKHVRYQLRYYPMRTKVRVRREGFEPSEAGF